MRLEQVLAELRAKQPRRFIVVYENERRPIVGDPHPEASPEGYHSSELLDIERPNFSDSEFSTDCNRLSAACGRVNLVALVRYIGLTLAHLICRYWSETSVGSKNTSRRYAARGHRMGVGWRLET